MTTERVNIFPDIVLKTINDKSREVKTLRWLMRDARKFVSMILLSCLQKLFHVFIMLQILFMSDEKNFILSKKLGNCWFDEHFHAFEIKNEHDFQWTMLTLKDISPKPTIVTKRIKLIGNKQYVPKLWL